MKFTVLKQGKPRPKIGGVQMQLSFTFSYYIVYVNLSFMGMMFWHTTAGPFLRQYFPGADFWMFATFMILLILSLMVFDHKVIYPSRQAFLSQQAYKHANPVVRDVGKLLAENEEIKADLKAIKDKLGIEE